MSLRILHVEDEAPFVTVVQCLLGQEDYVVDVVPSLARAREQMAAISYDIVLLDLNLPDSFGLDTLCTLRVYGVPIIVISAMDNPALLKSAAGLGADDYILKDEITRVGLLSRIAFTHTRHQHAMAGSARPRRAKRLGSSAFESLKPYLTCSAATANPFGC